jgi:hypothetical protein
VEAVAEGEFDVFGEAFSFGRTNRVEMVGELKANVAIEVDEEAGTAVSRAYFTALQALPDLALQPIVSGRDHDRFERRDGQWRFV